jgi:hypothetical protein
MAEFTFDYKPFDFYGGGGGGGGGHGGGGHGGGGGGGGHGGGKGGKGDGKGGKGRKNNQNSDRFNGDGQGDHMDWKSGRGDDMNRFRGRGDGGGVRKRPMGSMGVPEPRDMFGVKNGMPQTTIGAGGGMPNGGFGGGGGALGVGVSPAGGGPRPNGGPMPMPARGGGPSGGGTPNFFASNGQIDTSQQGALAKLMGDSAQGVNMPGSNYTAPGTGMALSAGGGGDGGMLTPQQQQAKALQYAMHYSDLDGNGRGDNGANLGQIAGAAGYGAYSAAPGKQPSWGARAPGGDYTGGDKSGLTLSVDDYGGMGKNMGPNDMNANAVIRKMQQGKIPYPQGYAPTPPRMPRR